MSSTRRVLGFFIIFALRFSSSFIPSLNTRANLALYGNIKNKDYHHEDEPIIQKEMSRRSMFSTSLVLLTGGVLTGIPSSSEAAVSINEQVKAIETANFIGSIGKPIYTPNTGGDPQKYMPRVKVSDDRTVNVSVTVSPTKDDYVQFIWLKDANTDEVVLVKAFPPPAEDVTTDFPILAAKVPAGVTLRPYSFSTGSGLWKGDDFKVN